MDYVWKEYDEGSSKGLFAKRKFDRFSLNLYMNKHICDDICKESFTDFFDIDTVNLIDSSTNYFITHLLFYDFYDFNKISKVLNFIFDYIEPNEVTHDKGFSFLARMFLRKPAFSDDEIKSIIETAIQNGFNMECYDFNGNNLLSYALVGSSYNGNLADLFQYFSDPEILCRQNRYCYSTFDLIRYCILSYIHSNNIFTWLNYSFSDNSYSYGHCCDKEIWTFKIPNVDLVSMIDKYNADVFLKKIGKYDDDDISTFLEKKHFSLFDDKNIKKIGTYKKSK